MATMIEYSVAEVGTMLEKNGLGKYTAVFKDKGVDGKKLCAMNADELKKLGVTNELHVKALMQRIELYRDQQPSTAAASGGAKPNPLAAAMAAFVAGYTKCMATVGEAATRCMEPVVGGLSSCTEAVKGALPMGGGGGKPPTAARGRRGQVIAPSVKVPDGWKPPVHAKSDEENKFLKESLAANKLFKNLAPSDIDVLVKAFHKASYKKGEAIITQGDKGDKAATFYLLDSGSCDISITGKGSVMKATKGVAFGELALLHNAPRAATVTAESAVTAWAVDATTFKSILMGKAKDDAKDYKGFIETVPLLKGLKKGEVQSLLDALTEVSYKVGDVIIKEGDKGDAFFIIRDGEVKCTKKGSAEEVSDRLKRAAFFGELALLSSEEGKRAATVTATQPTTVLRLERDAFERVLGPSKAVLKDAASAQGRK